MNFTRSIFFHLKHGPKMGGWQAAADTAKAKLKESKIKASCSYNTFSRSKNVLANQVLVYLPHQDKAITDP